MEKLIIDDIYFKVEASEQKAFIEKAKKLKAMLKEKNLLPVDISLYQDIDKEKDVFKLYMVFKSDKAFDEWEAKMPKELSEMFSKEFMKYVVRYNYAEKIDID